MLVVDAEVMYIQIKASSGKPKRSRAIRRIKSRQREIKPHSAHSQLARIFHVSSLIWRDE